MLTKGQKRATKIDEDLIHKGSHRNVHFELSSLSESEQEPATFNKGKRLSSINYIAPSKYDERRESNPEQLNE